MPNLVSTPASLNGYSLAFSTVNDTIQLPIGYFSQNILQGTPNMSSLSLSGVYTATSASTPMYLIGTVNYTGGSLTIGSSTTYFVYTATRIA